MGELKLPAHRLRLHRPGPCAGNWGVGPRVDLPRCGVGSGAAPWPEKEAAGTSVSLALAPASSSKCRSLPPGPCPASGKSHTERAQLPRVICSVKSQNVLTHSGRQNAPTPVAWGRGSVLPVLGSLLHDHRGSGSSEGP